MICFNFEHVCDDLETKQQTQMVSNIMFAMCLLRVVASMSGRARRRRGPVAVSKPLVNLKHLICLT